jgi:hypothetical protein
VAPSVIEFGAQMVQDFSNYLYKEGDQLQGERRLNPHSPSGSKILPHASGLGEWFPGETG